MPRQTKLLSKICENLTQVCLPQMGAVHFLHCAHLSGLSSPPGLSSHVSIVDKHSVLDFWNYRRFSVDNFHHVKLPTGRPGGRLVTKQPDSRPGSSELAPVHLQHTYYKLFWWSALKWIFRVRCFQEVSSSLISTLAGRLARTSR